MQQGPSGYCRKGILTTVIFLVLRLGTAVQAQTISATPPHEWPGVSVQPYVTLHQMRAPSKAQKEARRAAEDIRRGNSESAKRHIEAALDAYNDYSVALALRAMLEFTEYDDEHALADVRRSMSVDPGCALAYLLNAEIYSSTGKYEEALALLKRSSELLSWAWQYHYELCKALLGTRQYTVSLSAINTALQLSSPTNATQHDLALLHFFRAWTYARLNDTTSARTEYQQAQQGDPRGDVGTEASHQLALLH